MSAPTVDLLPAYRDAVAQRWADGLLTDGASVLALRIADYADDTGTVSDLKWSSVYSLADMTAHEGRNARRVLLGLGLLHRGPNSEWFLGDIPDWHNPESEDE